MNKKLRLFYVFLTSSFLTLPSLIGNSNFVKATAEGVTTFIQKDFSVDSLNPEEDSDLITAYSVKTTTVDGVTGISPANGESIRNYVTYKVTSDETFTTMQVSLSGGRFACYSSSQGNKISFFVSTTPEDYLLGYVASQEGTETPVSTVNCDMTSKVFALNSNTLYVTINFGTTMQNTGFDESWICLRHLTIQGTTGTVSMNNYSTGDNWTESNARVGVTNNITDTAGFHGALAGANIWDPRTIEAGTAGSVTYQITANQGEIIRSFDAYGLFRYDSMGNDSIYSGDWIDIYYSLDNTNWTKIMTTTHYPNAFYYDSYYGPTYSYPYYSFEGLKDDGGKSLSITEGTYAKTLFVKFEMRHDNALTNIDINAWGTCFYETGVSYKTQYYNYSETLEDIKAVNSCTEYGRVDELKSEISHLSSEEQAQIMNEEFVDLHDGKTYTVSYKLAYLESLNNNGGVLGNGFYNASLNEEAPAITIAIIIAGVSIVSLLAILVLKKKR